MTRSVNSCNLVAIHCVFSVKDNTHMAKAFFLQLFRSGRFIGFEDHEQIGEECDKGGFQNRKETGDEKSGCGNAAIDTKGFE